MGAPTGAPICYAGNRKPACRNCRNKARCRCCGPPNMLACILRGVVNVDAKDSRAETEGDHPVELYIGGGDSSSGVVIIEEPTPLTIYAGQIARELAAAGLEMDLRYCFECARCSSACKAAFFSTETERQTPRSIIYRLVLGMEQEILDGEFTWLCSGSPLRGELSPGSEVSRTGEGPAASSNREGYGQSLRRARKQAHLHALWSLCGSMPRGCCEHC